ncbi:hypothetical protein K1T71_013710 [Dendrolimus kikuchii]|uniref:Uncharacterized protein n=1 Tax=Dendrolimus kikuchii TaxID=765133 RepID=A0ACC1CHE3_9NEOP|nr:hypothetical protein K1T71_014762 [Dendrolimus kikuchii]KAJ0170938.1 hypothetical protein K1T71_013710 [Dendrolimus kikuchii]
MILTSRTLCGTQRVLNSCDLTELLWVTLPAQTISTTSDLHLCVIYVPPDPYLISRDVDITVNILTETVTALPKDNYLIIGDFNLPCVNWKTGFPLFLKKGPIEVQNAAARLLEQFEYLSLTQYNFLCNSAGNTLDLAFCNLPITLVSSSAPLLKEDAAHPSFCMEIHDLQSKPLQESLVPKHNFNKADYEQINKYIYSLNWQAMFSTDNIDQALDNFYDIIELCVDKYVPLSRKGFKRSYPPWYSVALIKIIKEKTKAHSRWKKFGNRLDYDEFSLLRARERRIQKKCFNDFTANCEKNIKSHPKVFWTYVKALRGGSSYPKIMSLGTKKFSEGKDICDGFNSFFKSVFGQPSNYQHRNQSEQVSVNISTLSRIQTNISTVEVFLKQLDKDKGAGSDGIPPVFWNSCYKSLAPPLCAIFNRSLREGVFPSKWKSAHIIPIHKKGSKAHIENYRGISILNTVAKVFERIVYKDLYPIISFSLPDRQHGFLKKRSTITNLACFTDYVLKNMEGGGQVDVIYTDFEKAFDRVDHNILIDKLNKLGVHGDLLRWLKSYLSCRSQAVVLGGYRSDFIKIPTGVPQGSHLGPLLYNAYIYDINDCLKNSEYLMYADDKKIFFRIKSEIDCLRIQSDLDCLSAYYTKNNINLNIQKCECISFTRKIKPIFYNYNFSGTPIKRVRYVRDLGVYFDDKMTMSNHIDIIVNKAFKNLGFVLRICKCFSDISVIKSVYYSFVRSILEYASPIWSPKYVIYKERLERIQRIFCNHINYLSRISPNSYKDSCSSHRLLSLDERRTVLDMSLLYEIVHSRVDCPELVSKLAYNVPRYRTRHTSLLNVPCNSTNYTQNSLFSRMARTYNTKFCKIDLFASSKYKFKSNIINDLLNFT